MKNVIITMLLLTCFATSAFAVPFLQLDISDGTYLGPPDETVVSTGDSFTLYALVDPNSSDYVSGNTYYVSAAIIPQVRVGGDYGSFDFNGDQIDVTADMIFGTPPIELLAQNLDLPGHGIFETYFTEFSFNLTGATQSVVYNVQDTPGGYSLLPGGSSDPFLYAVAFAVDVSDLNTDYEIHFDLYTKTYNNKGELTIDKFAPFSHDAQSGDDGGVPPQLIPEPSTFVLLFAGLFGLAVYRRKKG